MNQVPYELSPKISAMAKMTIKRDGKFIHVGHVFISDISDAKNRLQSFYEKSGLIEKAYFEYFNPITRTHVNLVASTTN